HAAQESPEVGTFWTRYLTGVAATRLPDRHGGRDARTVHSARTVHGADLAVSAPDTARLQELARTAGLPPRALFLAVHAITLGRLRPDADEVLVGHVTHGRPDVTGAESALGLFLNTVPLRVPLDGSWLDVARAVAAAERDVNPYRRLSTAGIQQAGNGLVIENVCYLTDFHVLDP